MKTKFKNKLRYVAAGIFLLGLMANVSLSLTDPFVHVGAELLAQATSGTNSGTNDGCETIVTATDLETITCGGEVFPSKQKIKKECKSGFSGSCDIGEGTIRITYGSECNVLTKGNIATLTLFCN